MTPQSPAPAISPLSRPYNWALHRLFWQDARRWSPSLTGRCLDLGCGSQPYRPLIEPHVSSYVPVDYDTHRGTRRPLARVDAMAIPFADASFDSAVCFQVLEHIRDPRRTLAELNRVLRPGAPLYMTTPFLWMVHEEPYDFYRYTEFGLRALLEEAGFEIVNLKPLGGALLTIAMHVNYFTQPLAGWNRLGPAQILINWPLRALWWLDQHLALAIDRRRKTPAHATAYSVLARKKDH
jgi:SAM-dependent methyltransferase